jgi:hypothetical protein
MVCGFAVLRLDYHEHGDLLLPSFQFVPQNRLPSPTTDRTIDRFQSAQAKILTLRPRSRPLAAMNCAC